jgi:hypothetical protein|nr:MAG TPA_asm: hypothetical protein [Caudoviricetes sp.]
MKKAYIPRMGVPQKVAQTQKAVAIKEAALRKIMIETGGMERINELLSAGYLLQSFAATFFEEADGLLEKYGLKMGQMKMLFNKAQRSNDDYFNTFSKLMTETSKGADTHIVWAQHADRLRDVFFANFPSFHKDWEPKTAGLQDVLKDLQDRYGVDIVFTPKKLEDESNK